MDTLVRLFADGLLVIIIAIAGMMAIKGVQWRNWQQVLPMAVMAGLTSLLVGKLLSLIYQPSMTRPFIEQGVAAGAAYIDNPGFPSDHVLLAVVVVCAVYFITPYKKMAIILGIFVVIMAVARVLALVHTPLDIFGGVVAGLSGAIWYHKMLKDSTISKLHN